MRVVHFAVAGHFIAACFRFLHSLLSLRCVASDCDGPACFDHLALGPGAASLHHWNGDIEVGWHKGLGF